MKSLLAQIPLFSNLPDAELDRVLASLEVKELQAGEILFREGDPSEHLYVVVSGVLLVLPWLGSWVGNWSRSC